MTKVMQNLRNFGATVDRVPVFNSIEGSSPPLTFPLSQDYALKDRGSAKHVISERS